MRYTLQRTFNNFCGFVVHVLTHLGANYTVCNSVYLPTAPYIRLNRRNTGKFVTCLNEVLIIWRHVKEEKSSLSSTEYKSMLSDKISSKTYKKVLLYQDNTCQISGIMGKNYQ